MHPSAELRAEGAYVKARPTSTQKKNRKGEENLFHLEYYESALWAVWACFMMKVSSNPAGILHI